MVDVKMARLPKKVSIVLNILFIIGMLLSIYLLYEHFAPVTSKFCKFGNSFDCGVVSKSPYANLDGISYLLTIDYQLPLPLINIAGIHPFFDFVTANAFLGFLMLIFLLLLVNAWSRNRSVFGIDVRHMPSIITTLIAISLLYGMFLIYIQHSILKTYCILCLALDAVLLATAVIWWHVKK